MRALLPLALAAIAALPACATLPESAGGSNGLPSANAGPFRALVASELGGFRVAPNGLEDDNDYGRDPAVIRADDASSSMAVFGYVAAAAEENGQLPVPTSPTRTITRYGALDGRTFDNSALVVLTADQPWEGGLLAAPAVIRVGGELFLYYAAAGGVGLARGTDGTTFTKVTGPVLAPDPTGWEHGAPPASPGVVQLGDGSFRMFYEIAIVPGESAIGEASSSDGVKWTRLGSAPALAPAVGDTDAATAPYDGASVGSPFPMLATSAEGRAILRVYYGATDGSGVRTVGLAARYGTDGALQRAETPVFGSNGTLGPREPCVVAFGDVLLLYVTESADTTDTTPVVAEGVAPATATLPPPISAM
jgi:hypothetical protein